jgi:hypothetical protein
MELVKFHGWEDTVDGTVGLLVFALIISSADRENKHIFTRISR